MYLFYFLNRNDNYTLVLLHFLKLLLESLIAKKKGS